MKHGIFELPLNLKRSHFSYAHTDDDVDRLLEATEEAVKTVLAPRVTTPRGHVARSTWRRPASRSGGCSTRRSRTRPAGPTSSSRSRRFANGDGPTVLVSGGNHGDEYEGQIAAAAARQRAAARAGARPR